MFDANRHAIEAHEVSQHNVGRSRKRKYYVAKGIECGITNGNGPGTGYIKIDLKISGT